MRFLEDLNYYEILEVSPQASPSQIRQAHQNLVALYQNDPVVTDSFFSETEKDQIIQILHEAFAVLNDPDRKTAYDRNISAAGTIERPPDPKTAAEGPENSVSPLLPETTPGETTSLQNKIQEIGSQVRIRETVARLSRQETISGADIQSLRRAFGLTVANIFEITRIGTSVIRAIEENRFEDLPPRVYLKSFLNDYARLLQFPPDILSEKYLKQMTAASTA